MANGITNAELYEALRKVGLEEADALRLAKAVPPAETIATKADLERVIASIPKAETLASKVEVEVLQADAGTTKGTLQRLLNQQGDLKGDVADIKAGAKFDRKLLVIMLTALLGLFLKDFFSG